MKLPFHAWLLAGAFTALCSPLVQAGVTIDGTRVIYPAGEREVTVKLNNEGRTPSLMQVWVDRGDIQSQPQDADAPFLLTPPIFRIDPNKSQSVRLTFTGAALPKDRESLFWLNALEIPPLPKADGRSFMQVAVRTRLKLFYRPAGLAGDLPSAVKQVDWQVVAVAGGYALRGKNASPYHVSYSALSLEQGGRRYDAGQGMIAPFSSHDFPLRGLAGKASGGQLHYRWMSDYGVGAEQRAAVH
ncbi:fimbrial biogenesis chaperone [Pseudomonas citronellolis]|uniref:fimbrial biogenesis chaperone n=1 Tax=Pseudomonas citronellolis TaxID=53408 RepID=UPI0023E406A4|nr:fimbria/pilus periplasmic chaperone [Pseudomonas citronellolis]MDF3931447.1 fimbria/pilus periplasmic chaperone [Pseudomonas citronellolis]